MTRAIGIDLGTTSTRVCVWQNDVGAEVITNDEGNRSTPSYVSFTESGCLVGDAALRNTARNPHNTVFDMKRLLQRDLSDTTVQADVARLPFQVFERDARPHIRVQDRGQTREFSPEEVLSFILAKVKEAAGLHLGGVVTSATVAVPAHFALSQRQAIKRAATIAGLDVRLISEAGACAIAYNLDNRAPIERNVLVFDLGGGSLDVSLLAIEDGVVEVKTTAGLPHLGGEDFDNRLVDHFADEFMRKHRKDISGNARALLRLRTQCEHAKRALSSSSRATIEVDCLFDNVDFVASITRPRFEELCEDLFQSMLKPLAKVLRDAKFDNAQVHEIVLAGGSTRIPRIASLVSAFFDGKKPRSSLNPDEAVARGAAIHAALIAGPRTASAKAPATRDLVLLDRAPFSLGVEAAGGAMVPVLTPNTVVPARRSVLFTTHIDDQPGVFIQVYEGDRPRAQGNRLLGRFVLTGIPPAPRGVPRIEVAFDFGTDEALVVSATDTSSGRSKRMSTADARRGLSEEEMEQMCANAERHYRGPAERVAAKERLERYVSGACAALKELEGALNNTNLWLVGAQEASKEEYTERHRGVEAAAGTAIQKLSAFAHADAEVSEVRVVDQRYLRSWQITRV